MEMGGSIWRQGRKRWADGIVWRSLADSKRHDDEFGSNVTWYSYKHI